MFIRQVTYSKNDPARPAYAAGQGIAVAAGGIKGKLSFSHRAVFSSHISLTSLLIAIVFPIARLFAICSEQVRQHADKLDPAMP